MSDITFVPIQPDDSKRKLNGRLGCNMKPLSGNEILRTGDAWHCPECKKARFMMMQAVLPQPFPYMGEYCTCS